jgi:hypothetical protein
VPRRQARSARARPNVTPGYYKRRPDQAAFDEEASTASATR